MRHHGSPVGRRGPRVRIGLYSGLVSTDSTDLDLRRALARLVRRLLDEPTGTRGVGSLIVEHLGSEAGGYPVLTEELASWELANLQLALDAMLARPGWGARVVGIAGAGKRFSMLSLGDLIQCDEGAMGGHFALGPPEYVTAPAGPGRTIPCLEFAVLLVASPQGPACLFVRRAEQHGPVASLAVQAVAQDRALAGTILADLRVLMLEHDVYRGQAITVEVDPHGGSSVAFLERSPMPAADLVLPDGVLDRIERHLVAPTRHRAALVASGRHLSRGLLLWGPPGTGKTHTVRYLTGLLADATIIVLSGGSLGMVGAFAGLAKRLAPSVVVLEDVDLVAQERAFGPFGSSPVLFELLNEMSGLGDDADVAFVLTTNRPDTLEPALAARPGRVDLAVEIPLPDDDARRRLLDLYGRGLDLRLADPEAVVARTAGVTASFIRELLRVAALAAMEAGGSTVTDEVLGAALDEMMSDRSALTRVILGGQPSSVPALPEHHAWLTGGGGGVQVFGVEEG